MSGKGATSKLSGGARQLPKKIPKTVKELFEFFKKKAREDDFERALGHSDDETSSQAVQKVATKKRKRILENDSDSSIELPPDSDDELRIINSEGVVENQNISQ